MRILIDATPLLVRSAGVKNYLFHWLTHLRAQAGPDEVLAFPFVKHLGVLRHDRSTLPWSATLWRLALLSFFNSTHRGWIRLALQDAHVLHASNLLADLPHGPAITATIHDLTSWLMPEVHHRGNIEADRRFAEHVLPRASRLIAVSEATKRDATQILKLAPEKIEVIYPGVDPRFFEATKSEAAAVARRYQLQHPFILFVGTIEPRKNVDRLIDAYLRLPRSLQHQFDLVVAGPKGWASQSTLARLQAYPGRVRYLGYVPDRDLPSLTAAATLFVYPSLYEGFGFPVVQAMAAGVPVITSRRASLPEVAADCARLVNPEDLQELTTALEELLVSEDLRSKLSAAGRQRAQAFRWEVTAQRSLQFFHRAAQFAGLM